MWNMFLYPDWVILQIVIVGLLQIVNLQLAQKSGRPVIFLSLSEKFRLFKLKQLLFLHSSHYSRFGLFEFSCDMYLKMQFLSVFGVVGLGAWGLDRFDKKYKVLSLQCRVGASEIGMQTGRFWAGTMLDLEPFCKGGSGSSSDSEPVSWF